MSNQKNNNKHRSDVHWEDRTLLYFNRFVQQYLLKGIHIIQEEDGQWTAWWEQRMPDNSNIEIGRSTTRTLALSLLTSIKAIIYRHEGKYREGSQPYNEHHLLMDFFAKLKVSLSNKLNQIIPDILFHHRRYKNRYWQPVIEYEKKVNQGEID